MKTYYVAETQNTKSIRLPEKIVARNLKGAKRKAMLGQMYQKTTLSIFDQLDCNGYGIELLATKDTANTNKWS